MWAILGLVLLADALDVIDATVTNIAAPTIAGDLHGGESLIKWLGPAYMLAMGVLLAVGGRLGDKFGQRRLFLIGMGGFTLASAVAGFSPDPALLIAARVAQGAFGALLIPQGMAIMTKAFSRDMLAKSFGLFGPVLGLSSVGGPVLAGFICSADLFGLSWRPIFLANVILGTIGLVIAVKILPRDDDGDRSTVVDGWGSGLLAATMIGLLYGLIEGSTNGWSAVAVASITLGVLFFAAFAYRQRTATHPLIKPSLLKNRSTRGRQAWQESCPIDPTIRDQDVWQRRRRRQPRRVKSGGRRPAEDLGAAYSDRTLGTGADPNSETVS